MYFHGMEYGSCHQYTTGKGRFAECQEKTVGKHATLMSAAKKHLANKNKKCKFQFLPSNFTILTIITPI
jgi:hypothetical protein